MPESVESSPRHEQTGSYGRDPQTTRDIEIILGRQARGLTADEDVLQTSSERERLEAGREPGVRDGLIAAAKANLKKGPSERAAAAIADSRANIQARKEMDLILARQKLAEATRGQRNIMPQEDRGEGVDEKI